MNLYPLVILITLLLLHFSSYASNKKVLASFLTVLSEDIQRVYVVEEKIPEILEILSSARLLVESNKIDNKSDLSDFLNNRLTKVDKHFSFSVHRDHKQPNNKTVESFWEKLERKNSGVTHVEILDGNVGYINLIGFDRVDAESTRKIETAMSILLGVDSIIFDLRNNGGGSPDMVALIASYFFKKAVPLSSIYDREKDRLTEFQTLARTKSHSLANMPLHILTSANTFSAGEAFAYDLQQYNRAIIVGESTGGGANPIRTYLYDEGFVVSLPYARAINPITESNWEGEGVQPSHITEPELAFDKAYCLSLLAVQYQISDAFVLKEVNAKLHELNCEISETGK